MPLVLTVALIVLAVVVVVGVAGTLIDSAEEKLEHPAGAPRPKHDGV